MRQRRCLAAVLGLVWTLLAVPAAAAEGGSYSPTDRFFVNDFAGVLSAEAEETIFAQGKALYERTKAQVVAVTVPSLEGADIREYALDLGRRWGVGEKEKNTGVVLLLAMEERRVTIEVGYGLEGALPDIKAGRILDTYATPKFKQDDYSGGMADAYRSLVNEVYIEFGLDPDEGYTPIDDLVHQDDDGGVVYVVIALLMIVLFLAFFGRRGRGGRGGPPFIFFGGPHHGGGFGGGGFGGGGGFRGGGGSFGGGGASRGF